MKIKKNWNGGRGEGSGWGGQGGYDRRIEVFGKIHKKKYFFGGGGSGEGVGLGRGGGGSGWLRGGQGGCERRIEVFVKIQKKMGGSGLEVRVDVNEEFKFLGKFTQKKLGGGGGREEIGDLVGGGSGWM